MLQHAQWSMHLITFGRLTHPTVPPLLQSSVVEGGTVEVPRPVYETTQITGSVGGVQGVRVIS